MPKFMSINLTTMNSVLLHKRKKYFIFNKTKQIDL